MSRTIRRPARLGIRAPDLCRCCGLPRGGLLGSAGPELQSPASASRRHAPSSSHPRAGSTRQAQPPRRSPSAVRSRWRPRARRSSWRPARTRPRAHDRSVAHPALGARRDGAARGQHDDPRRSVGACCARLAHALDGCRPRAGRYSSMRTVGARAIRSSDSSPAAARSRPPARPPPWDYQLLRRHHRQMALRRTGSGAPPGPTGRPTSACS